MEVDIGSEMKKVKASTGRMEGLDVLEETGTYFSIEGYGR